MKDVYEIRPGEEGTWRFSRADSDRAIKIFQRKNEARSHAREVVRNQEGELVVYTRSGKRQAKTDFSDDA